MNKLVAKIIVNEKGMDLLLPEHNQKQGSYPVKLHFIRNEPANFETLEQFKILYLLYELQDWDDLAYSLFLYQVSEPFVEIAHIQDIGPPRVSAEIVLEPPFLWEERTVPSVSTECNRHDQSKENGRSHSVMESLNKNNNEWEM